MPSTSSAWKRMRSDERKRQRNQSVKSAVKTAVRKVREAVNKKDTEAVKATLSSAFSCLDKAAKKGALPKNRVHRKKSRIAKQANSVINSAPTA